ncbi:MAG: AMP-binding protein, partial [Spirochaetia bacterium]|nr:AMP-binding protein [Spirochaetia bacterium]
GENDRGMSLLPPWHVYERILEYYSVMQGIDFLITNMSSLRDDLRDFKPTIFPSVPRIWESVYNGIMGRVSKESKIKRKIFSFCLSVGQLWSRKVAVLFGYNPAVQKPFFLVSFFKRVWALNVLCFLLLPKLFAKKVFSNIHQALGGRLRISVSGGSALPAHVDRFLSAVGILVVEGYGMTEVCGIIAVRSSEKPTPGALGRPLRGYQIRLKDETGADVSGQVGKKGVLWVKTDQLFAGYYREPELTRSMFDADGFYDTGDVMILSYRGELMFAGRAKDTIVLGGGENVEPSPIEDRLLESPYVDQVVVVGNEKKTLAALLVPNVDKVREAVPGAPESTEEWNHHPDVRALFKAEIGRLITRDKGFKPFEMIPGNHFAVLPRGFDPDREMTRTLKIKRNVVFDNYAAAIHAIYHD